MYLVRGIGTATSQTEKSNDHPQRHHRLGAGREGIEMKRFCNVTLSPLPEKPDGDLVSYEDAQSAITAAVRAENERCASGDIRRAARVMEETA